MKLDRDLALELMALADGELEGEARERALQRIAANARAREVALQMGDPRAGAWLREAMDNRAVAAGADGVADEVLAKIESDAGVPRASRGPWSRFQSTVGATATLGLAAGIALYLSTRPSRPTSGWAGADHAPVSQAAAAASGGGVEVDEIDAPAHDISVFEISGAGGALAANPSPSSSIVIWIEDEPGGQ